MIAHESILIAEYLDVPWPPFAAAPSYSAFEQG
jgi:hypothetical protein